MLFGKNNATKAFGALDTKQSMALISEKRKTNGLSCAAAPVSGMKVMSRLRHNEVKALYTVS